MTRQNPIHLYFMRLIRFLPGILLATHAAAQPLQPPPIPTVRPVIARNYPNDNNGDKLEDALANRAEHLRLVQTQKQPGAERAAAHAARRRGLTCARSTPS